MASYALHAVAAAARKVTSNHTTKLINNDFTVINRWTRAFL